MALDAMEWLGALDIQAALSAVATGLLGLLFGTLIGASRTRRARRLEIEALRREAASALDLRDDAVTDRDAAMTRREMSDRMRTAAENELADYVGRVQSAVQGVALTRPFDRGSRPPWRRMTSQIPIIAIGNLKGGVGKTTLAANLGAYIADARDRAAANRDPIDGPQRPVLFIDLDFQGSLSATLLNQIGGTNQNRSALLFEQDATPAGLLSRAPRLVAPDLPVVEGCRFFDCGYEAAALEDRLLFDWAVTKGSDDDLRLRLARFLHSQDVQTRFRAVVLDLPPRSTTFAINALCAATDLVIPMRADALSSEAVGLFMQQLESLRERLWPTLSIAGLVGVMTEGAEPSRAERLVLAEAADDARQRWGGDGGRLKVLTTVPSRAHIGFSAGKSFAYFNHRDGDVGATPHDIFLDVGRRVTAALSRTP